MEEGPVRADPRQDRAADHGRRARLPERVQALYCTRPLDGQAGQRRQGHRLEDRHRSRTARPAERQDADRGRDEGHAEDRDRHRRLRGHPAAGAGDQRPRGGEGLAGSGQADRARPHPPGAVPRGRKDPLPRRAGSAAQDHQQPHMERHRERDRFVQRRLHQRARVHPLAHVDRPPAVLPRSPVGDRLRRGVQQLPPAGGPEDHGRHPQHQAEREQGDPAQLHHAAPEVGHPQHLQRQPDDADAEPRRPGGVAERRRRQAQRY